jgi:hypothetical protein
LSLAIGATFKNVDGVIDLCEKFFSIEVSIAIFSGLEDELGFPCGCENVK